SDNAMLESCTMRELDQAGVLWDSEIREGTAILQPWQTSASNHAKPETMRRASKAIWPAAQESTIGTGDVSATLLELKLVDSLKMWSQVESDGLSGRSLAGCQPIEL